MSDLRDKIAEIIVLDAIGSETPQNMAADAIMELPEIAQVQARITELTKVLTWLDKGGGLGLDKHARIREALEAKHD
jgi:hypothetical protein